MTTSQASNAARVSVRPEAPHSTTETPKALLQAIADHSHSGAAVRLPEPSHQSADWEQLEGDLVRVLLDHLLLGRFTDSALEYLLSSGFLKTWLPEVEDMVGFGDGEWRHKDVWKHTKQVVRQAVRRPLVRWAALLHDIGKVKTRSFGPKGEVHFFGHSEVGAAMFRKRIAKRLAFDRTMSRGLHFLILHHLRASQYDGTWTDSAVRRFRREMGDYLVDLLDLSRADITTKRPEKKKRGLASISELGGRVRELEKEDAKVAPLPKGLGTKIMTHFGLPQSRRVGEIRDMLEQRIESGELEPQREPSYYIDWLDRHPHLFKGAVEGAVEGAVSGAVSGALERS